MFLFIFQAHRQRPASRFRRASLSRRTTRARTSCSSSAQLVLGAAGRQLDGARRPLSAHEEVHLLASVRPRPHLQLGRPTGLVGRSCKLILIRKDS